ncbi:hypothetical protein GCM10009721_11670 [Terrabacter tumescens]|uniref:DUF4194 domain-containing protein n=1 Tax=Terrabacter tumescens TaxID=60443 RepID=A0ABQ2HR07_9MICO|nr:DUF4194 domain-containing protein [Terrabacter tumescens]GGM88303.1 hypothetical protein GCM10009721_11670 [Terrabacter tumescens]
MTPISDAASAPSLTDDVLDLSRVVVPLLRGVVYQADNAALWALLRRQQARVRDHMAVMGLDLIVDEAEGYAHLRQMDYDELDIPRLVPRHRLSFPVSLLLALLRKRLAEFDASSSDPRLILTRDQVAELLRVHLPQSTNEVRLTSDVDALLTKVVALGFLRQVSGQERTYEVRRILKAYVDAQWLAEFDARLREYLASVAPADQPVDARPDAPTDDEEPTDG